LATTRPFHHRSHNNRLGESAVADSKEGGRSVKAYSRAWGPEPKDIDSAQERGAFVAHVARHVCT